ncbi:MAG: M20 family metallopeptidase [Polyangiaceae bacterium]|nr:M20 family metallopeptidase [Polyangiaceae bacterium]
MPVDRQSLDRAVDTLAPELEALARALHANPETRFVEHESAKRIVALLERAGVAELREGIGGLSTAFEARAGDGARPCVALLAEYDALPEIGHACGHNLIAAGAVGAFLALARHAPELSGTVRLIGTPAEEGGGGKIILLKQGVFEGVDAALMYHPLDRDVLAHPALASSWVRLRFQGRPSHAAAAPWEGASALTACLETFRLIDSQRVHLRDGVRVHGIVTDGGKASNIIPEHAAADFSVRASTGKELERVLAMVERCARGAALACDVGVELEVVPGYRELHNNLTLARVFGAAMGALGRPARETDPRVGAGSTDMGDVSLVVPAIHPYLAICDEGAAFCHQHAFAGAAASDRGLETMRLAAKALARTVVELFERPSLLADAKHEHAASVGA